MKNFLIMTLVLFCFTGCYKIENKDSLTNSSDSLISKADSPAFIDSGIVDAGRIDSSEIDNVSDTIKVNPMSYDEAVRTNTSEGWRKFIEDNPSYKNKEEINEKIIRAEVNEIANDRNTGEMPSAEKIGNTKTSKSKVIIENDTSCDLTIRYSGPDARRITIAPNSKGTVELGSGNYTVAASACSYNYAGSETLSGNYSVVYYISTVRY